jgi:glycosyltransferase involved in cell wall biosynthesis
LFQQVTSRDFEIVVIDNDAKESGCSIVEAFQELARKRGVRLCYLVESEQNIALARNKAVNNISRQYVAFIDDDESAAPHWLESLCNTMEHYQADAVFGPVLKIFPEAFPPWLRKSALFANPSMVTGARPRRGIATGNVLLRKATTLINPGPFDPAFGRTGGEDTRLFQSLREMGCYFVWCNEAVVHETQEEERRRLRWHIRRGYRDGWVSVATKYRQGNIVKLIVYVVVHSVLGVVKVTVQSLLQVANPRGALWFFLRGMASQCGKIGYLLRAKVEEYVG